MYWSSDIKTLAIGIYIYISYIYWGLEKWGGLEISKFDLLGQISAIVVVRRMNIHKFDTDALLWI